jgi:tetratricopeptide (TPR) repeat protein
MKSRKLLIGSVLLVAVIVLAVIGWVVWGRSDTPAPPTIPFTDMEAPMVEAIQKAQDEVRREPRSAEAWGNLAMTLAANGFNPPALECYEHAERFDPTNPSWPYLRGLDLALSGRPHDAIPLYYKALSLTKDSEHRTAILFRLGLILIEDGQLDTAERELQELIKLDPKGPRIDYALGLLAFARDDQKSAREHLSKLTEVPFARRHSCALLATLSASDPEQARKFNEQVRQLTVDRPWPDPFESEMRRFKVDRMSRIARFYELGNAGRQREAILSLQRYVAQSPDAEVCAILAVALLDDGQLEQAEKMFRESLRYDQKNVKVHQLLAETLYLQGEKSLAEPGGKDKARPFFEEAVSEEDKALAFHPDLGRALSRRGQALHYLGRDDEAVKTLRKAVLAEPDNGETHLCLGETLGELGQFPEALEQLKYAVELATPKDERPRKALEKWQAKAKEPPK